MKLLNTNTKQGNAKLDKAAKYADLDAYRMASLSMMPDNKICPGSKAAKCFDACLKSAGRGRMGSVERARQAKTDYWHNDQAGFIAQLTDELAAFNRLCAKTDKVGAVRLNVLSDIAWESYIDLTQFEHIEFYDYTKRAKRFYQPMPANYRLTFSYSGVGGAYENSVKRAVDIGANIAVVFNGSLPFHFMGRNVIDGDKHDLRFLDPQNVIVGLTAKGAAKTDTSGFVVNV